MIQTKKPKWLEALVVCGVLSANSLALHAQTDGQSIPQRITTNSRMVGVGTTNILDTYLSPEEYHGTDIRYISHTLRKREGKRMLQEIVHQGNIAYVDTRSGSGKELTGNYRFQYGWHYACRSWQWGRQELRLEAGGNIELALGFLYNTRNSNNPAQAYFSLSVLPAAAVEYLFPNPFHRNSQRKCCLRYALGVPVVGLMFSPNYGQAYYEIFSKGNYDHNIVPTYPGNAPSLTHRLTFDFPLFRATCCIGYQGEYLQSHVNELKRHSYTHTLLVGIVKTFKLTKVNR